MAETYTKLLSSLPDSSVWRESHQTVRVWITMLAKADRDGYVWASVNGLADAARVTPDECRAALDLFMAPDPDSRSRDYEGRRIEEVERGWFLLNHGRFRDMRDEDEHRRKEREKKRAQRARAKAEREAAKVAQLTPEPTNPHDGSPNETICPANLAEQAEAILPDLVCSLRGSTLTQVRESAGRMAAYYIIGKGMGQKRRFWMRELRNWVVKDHGAGKLSGPKKREPRNAADALYARALAAEAEDKRLEAEKAAAE